MDPVGAEDARLPGHDNLRDAELLGDFAGVERAGASEGEERVLRGIRTIPNRDRSNRVRHLFGGDFGEALQERELRIEEGEWTG